MQGVNDAVFLPVAILNSTDNSPFKGRLYVSLLVSVWMGHATFAPFA